MANVLTTVVVLLYNDMPHGLDAIESVLLQSYQGFKLIIVDNGSTDGTWQAIQKYSNDPRVTLYKQPRNQRSDGVQAVTDMVDTKYISFLFADDKYAPNKLEHAMKLLEASPDKHYVFYNNEHADELGNDLNKLPPSWFNGDISSMDRWGHLCRFFTHGNSLHPCAMIVRTDTYRAVGGFPNYMHSMGDMYLFTRLLANYDGLFRPERMQRITVWSSGRNESYSIGASQEAFIAERSLFLEEYRRAPLIDNIERIFGYRQSSPAIRTQAQKLWFLAHQAIIQDHRLESRLFAMRMFYEAANYDDATLEKSVLETTGLTISEYIQAIFKRYQPKPVYIDYPFSIKNTVKKIPGSIWLYRKIKRLA